MVIKMEKVYRIDFLIGEKDRLYIDVRDTISLFTDFIFSENNCLLDHNTLKYILAIFESLIVTNEQNPSEDETFKLMDEKLKKIYTDIYEK